MPRTSKWGFQVPVPQQQNLELLVGEALQIIESNAPLVPNVDGLVHREIGETSGVPGAGATIWRRLVTTYFYLPAGMSQSRAKAVTGSTGVRVFSLRKNGVEFATLTYSSSSTGVFSMPSATSFQPDDEITLVAPNPADGSLASLYFTLHGRLPMSWTEAQTSFAAQPNVTVAGTLATKTGGVNGSYDAGVYSSKAIQYGEGFGRVKLPNSGYERIIGLNKTLGEYTNVNIDIGLYVSASNNLFTVEGGSITTLIGTHGTGDEIELKIEGTSVKRYKISAGVRTLLNTSAVTLSSSSYPLYCVASIATTGGQVGDMQVSGVIA